MCPANSTMASNHNDMHSLAMNYEIHDLRLAFTIRNFLDYECKPGTVLAMAEMECSNSCRSKWILQVCHIEESDEKDDIRVFLILKGTPPHVEIISATLEMSVVGEGDKKLKKIGPRNETEAVLRSGVGFYLSRREIARNKELYLPNGHLTIRCEWKEFLNPRDQRPSNLSSGILEKIDHESVCSDVVLKSGSSLFHCQKSILSERSAYFRVVFQRDLSDNPDNVVDLSNDLTKEELKSMLDFIYLGKL